jgi:hypothetical protein
MKGRGEDVREYRTFFASSQMGGFGGKGRGAKI